MFCKNCGQELPEGAYICPSCGSEQVEMMYCQHCGTKIPKSSTECPNCGATLVETKFCQHCGVKIPKDSTTCPSCGKTVENRAEKKIGASYEVSCPKCGSTNVTTQLFQENAGTTTVANTKSKYKQAGHGLLWWLFIGWWWWMVDLFLWVFAFPFRLVLQLFKKKKYKGNATTISQSTNIIRYNTMCLCGDCGNSWVKNTSSINIENAAQTVKKKIK